MAATVYAGSDAEVAAHVERIRGSIEGLTQEQRRKLLFGIGDGVPTTYDNTKPDEFRSHGYTTLPEAWAQQAVMKGMANQIEYRFKQALTPKQTALLVDVFSLQRYDGDISQISGTIVHYDPAMPSPNAPLGASRTMTQYRQRWKVSSKRSGLSYKQEGGFAATPEGTAEAMARQMQTIHAYNARLLVDCIVNCLMAPRQGNDHKSEGLHHLSLPFGMSTVTKVIDALQKRWAIFTTTRKPGAVLTTLATELKQARGGVEWDTLIVPERAMTLLNTSDEYTTFNQAGERGAIMGRDGKNILPRVIGGNLQLFECGSVHVSRDESVDPLGAVAPITEYTCTRPDLAMNAKEYVEEEDVISVLNHDTDCIESIPVRTIAYHSIMWDGDNLRPEFARAWGVDGASLWDWFHAKDPRNAIKFAKALALAAPIARGHGGDSYNYWYHNPMRTMEKDVADALPNFQALATLVGLQRALNNDDGKAEERFGREPVEEQLPDEILALIDEVLDDADLRRMGEHYGLDVIRAVFENIAKASSDIADFETTARPLAAGFANLYGCITALAAAPRTKGNKIRRRVIDAVVEMLATEPMVSYTLANALTNQYADDLFAQAQANFSSADVTVASISNAMDSMPEWLCPGNEDVTLHAESIVVLLTFFVPGAVRPDPNSATNRKIVSDQDDFGNIDIDFNAAGVMRRLQALPVNSLKRSHVDFLARINVPIPISFILFRTVQHNTSAVIMMRRATRPVRAYFSVPQAWMGHSASHQYTNCSFTIYTASTCTDPNEVAVFHNAVYNGPVDGSGGNTLLMGGSTRAVNQYQRGESNADWVAVPLGPFARVTAPNISPTGRWAHALQNASERAHDQLHYETAEAAKRVLGLTEEHVPFAAFATVPGEQNRPAQMAERACTFYPGGTDPYHHVVQGAGMFGPHVVYNGIVADRCGSGINNRQLGIKDVPGMEKRVLRTN